MRHDLRPHTGVFLRQQDLCRHIQHHLPLFFRQKFQRCCGLWGIGQVADPGLYPQFCLFFSGREGQFLYGFSGPQFCPIPLRRGWNIQRLADFVDGNIGNFVSFRHLCYRHGPNFLIQCFPMIHIIGLSKLFNCFWWSDVHLSSLNLWGLLWGCIHWRGYTGRLGGSFLLEGENLLCFLCICGTGQYLLQKFNDGIPIPRERRLFHRFSEVEFGPISRGRNRDLGRLDLCQTSGIWDTIFFGYTCHRYFPNFFIKFLSRQTNRSGRHHCSHLLFIQNRCFSLFDLKGLCFW